MLRIVALNEENQNDNNDDENQVTKEAEETIVITEYNKALSFKSKENNENALILFQELLDTKVLNEISFDDKTNSLFCVRYNCHKNIALIYEEKGNYDFALNHYINAINLDDTDVYTLNHLGQLALKLKKWELAEYAFQKCLARNPNHWPAADGMLQVLCSTENFLGAYGWAMKWYTKDENYKRAIEVLLEISDKFENLIPFFEGVYKCSFKPTETMLTNFKNKSKSLFPEYDNCIEDVIERPIKPDLDEFRQDCLNWLTVGKFIVSVYNHCVKTKHCLVFLLSVEDIAHVKIEEENIDTDLSSKSNGRVEDDDEEMNEKQGNQDDENNDGNEKFIAPANISSADCSQTSLQLDSTNAEDSDGQKTEAEPVKPKQRRRCSDLSFLEQWGWHKNRRYSSRKKSQQDRTEIDTTMNGFLRRIFSKYFEENFGNESPFLADLQIENDMPKKENVKNKPEDIEISFDTFLKKHDKDFQNFLKELKSQNFDLIRIIFLWLKYTSKYWDQPLTEEMKALYHSIYEFYLNHYDLVTWNQLSNDDFNASYRMMLFFMELDHDKSLIESKGHVKNEIDPRWKMLYYHLKFTSGCAFVISDDIYEKNIIRLIWLDYLSAKYENDLTRSVECLQFLETLIEKQKENFNLILPNLNSNNTINIELVKNIRIDLQRKISLSNVKNLYDNKKFGDLVEILKDSLINCTEIKNSDNTVMKIQTQFEVLLESFWYLEKYEECFIWSERCLKHAVENLLSAPTDTYRYKEWAECVNYILTYIEKLVLQETYEIFVSLEKYLSRLVQSLAKILVHQLDTPFDKNNNVTHPVDIKMPWVILHQVLQRTEDLSPVVIKQKSVEAVIEPEDIEEILPHTILILFTAHEFLGRRQWCTRDNGQLLLYTLNNIAPKFRAPFMDGYRDLVAEYLEQITYCLYGYPPKKARSRHIEEHDATPVELTWPRAIELFDLYRPESLPEFNSYKLDSISLDMEQLLLKILPLIPKENDPTRLTIHIKDFICGKVDELPEECSLLPHRIKCLYYLLADYYFKNRDFSKTIKYYTLDLICEPTRFDSWAGLALSKASKLETKLNSCVSFDIKEFLIQTEEAQRCFEQCIKLNKDHTLLWIEYGSFAFIIHSFCSRNLKHSTDTLSMEEFAFIETRKERYLKIAYDCFTFADKNIKMHHDDPVSDDNESHDEKWLHHYMLGKISEKRKDHPKEFLDHYLMAANFLYENNATYPLKINHNNPTTLSIEALEVHYRITSAIIKYLEQHEVINGDIGKLFSQVLKNLSRCPFAINQAKIDGNSINELKRKLAVEKAEMNKNKQPKIENVTENQSQNGVNCDNKSSLEKIETPPQTDEKIKEDIVPVQESKSVLQPKTLTDNNNKSTSPSRRVSQESTVTTVTTTTTGTGTSSSTSSSSESDSSSSDSTSSDSESASEESEDEKFDDNKPLTESQKEPMYKICVKNFEECVTRFSEHYKSIYRLVNHYLNGPDKLKNLEKCKQLLLGTYTATLGNKIFGLFSDRKNNNFFNGIWRIPSSEIDRPGGFSTHLVKCVIILLEVLRKSGDHKTLIDMALQLHRTPENDKRYIKDGERKELCQQAITFCGQVMRDILKQYTEKRNDTEIINLMIDIYKVHKKCIKHMNEREIVFSQLLIDTYKVYLEDKISKMPENVILLDLAIRFCLQEISARKNQEKQQQAVSQCSSVMSSTAVDMDAAISSTKIINPSAIPSNPMFTIKPQLPGAPRPRGRPVGSKNTSSISNIQNQSTSLPMNVPSMVDMSSLNPLPLYGNSALYSGFSKDPEYFSKFFALLKILSGSAYLNPSTIQAQSSFPSNPTLNPFLPTPTSISHMSPSFSPSASISPSMSFSSKPSTSTTAPQFDMKNFIASAASQAAKSTNSGQSSSTTISVGTGQLTITPTMSKPSVQTYPSPTPSHGSQMSPISNSSISVTKVPTTSPSLTVKPLSELTAPKSSSPSIPNLLDLPKSLTITPAPITTQEKTKNIQSHIPQVSVIPDTSVINPSKFIGKVKTSKKSKIPSTLYTKLPSTPFISSSSTSTALQTALLQQISLLENYNQQQSFIQAYNDLLSKNSNLALPPQSLSSLQFQMPTQKRPYTKRPRTSKTQPRYTNPLSMQQGTGNIDNISPIPSSMLSSTTSSKSKSQPFIPSSFNMPLSKSPLLPSSPNASPVLPNVAGLLPPHPSITPPILTQTSPIKTLQQKLAEKQKANALNESKSGNQQSNKKKDNSADVIVIE